MDFSFSLIQPAYSLPHSVAVTSSISLSSEPGPSCSLRSRRGRRCATAVGGGGRARRDLSPEGLDSSPSPEPPTPPGGRKRTRRGRGILRTSSCKGKGKGKGKRKAAKESTEIVWSTQDPKTKYPDFPHSWGPTRPLPYNAEPTQYFEQVYPHRLVEMIVQQTNLYANQRGVTDWEDTSVREIKAFLGFVMATSIQRVPRLNDIWSGDWVLGVPALAAVFTRKRFWQLWSNLHLVDNTQAPGRTDPSFDRLYKLRPMLTILADAFRAAHEPSQQVSVDEAMVRYKGRCSIKQYMPKKPIKRGFKIWCLCDANGGYLQEFQIYTGKTKRTIPTSP